MKINDKYEINPFGNIFDPLFSLVTRPESAMPYQSGYESDSVSVYGKVKIKNEDSQVRIEFLVPGWKKSDISLTVEPTKLRLQTDTSKKKADHGLFQCNDLNIEVLLPENLDTTKTKAKLEEGVLSVIIPNSGKNVGKSIKIS